MIEESLKTYEPALQSDPGASLIAILRRRWVVILLCAIVFPAAAFLWSSQQEKVYSAQSSVLLNQASLANSLTDTPDPSLRVDRDRQAKTQIEIAKIPEIGERTLKKLNIADLTQEQLADATTITAETGSDVLIIEVQDGDPRRAIALAATYAHQYTGMRARIDTRALATTLAEVRERLDGKHLGSDLRDSLKSKEATLSTLQTLQTRNSQVIRPAVTATQIEPTPARDAGLALILGLIVGCALALAIDARDRRIRGASQLAAAWNLPLLGRVPPIRSGQAGAIAMIADPDGDEADAYRFVVSSIEAAASDRPRTLLVVSASDREGRSRTAANLAVAFARAGEHVLAIDLDFSGTGMSDFFAATGRPGASDFATDAVGWSDAAVQVAIAADPSMNGNSGIAAGLGIGTLTVLTSGTMPASPSDFVGSASVRGLIEGVSKTFDRVVIDAPGLLGASDAALISHSVDAVVVVADVKQLSEEAVFECDRILDRVPAPKVGLLSTEDATARKILKRPARSAGRAPGRDQPVHVGGTGY
ncbi:MAG: hypothetical protein JHC98_05330 [Thermoleophilaceae bacterium]|nr:hypothetical protein [Thermoleophilaceae bacterium]